MPSLGGSPSPAYYRLRERVRREQTRILITKDLRPGCGKFDAVLARRMRKTSAWRSAA